MGALQIGPKHKMLVLEAALNDLNYTAVIYGDCLSKQIT
jgi:hypothetical protein